MQRFKDETVSSHAYENFKTRSLAGEKPLASLKTKPFPADDVLDEYYSIKKKNFLITANSSYNILIPE